MVRLLAVVILVFLFLPNSVFAQTTSDITSKIEFIGNPTKLRWPDTNSPCKYARNVWDLQIFGNLLYIGSGNSSNSSPCANAGPVPIISYNPATNLFTSGGTQAGNTIPEGQIDRFRLVDNNLVIPGHDPTGADELSWYKLESGTWVKRAMSNGTLHTYDIASFGGSLFTANGGGSSAVQVSTDGGSSWTASSVPAIARGSSLFTFGGKFYATTFFSTSSILHGPAIYQYNSGTSFTLVGGSSYRFQDMFPDQTLVPDTTPAAKMQRITNFGTSLVYIGASVVNDHQSDPFGIYALSGISTSGVSGVRKLTLPSNAKPWDVLIDQNGKLNVLGSVTNGSRYWVTVSSTTDLTNWTEDFRFDSPTFARSFEQLNSDWYFGLGTDTTTLANATGDIIRYKSATSPVPSVTQKPGDLDGDNDVDIFDYNILLTNFGKTGSGIQGDINNSGKVDIFDYNSLLSNFGT